MMARDAVVRAPSQCLSARVMERHNNQKYGAMSHFSFSFLNQKKPFSIRNVTIANLLERCMSCCATNNLLERCKFFQ